MPDLVFNVCPLRSVESLVGEGENRTKSSVPFRSLRSRSLAGWLSSLEWLNLRESCDIIPSVGGVFMKQDRENIATNPKAYHDYDIVEKIECGIALVGTEVKSVRARESEFKR